MPKSQLPTIAEAHYWQGKALEMLGDVPRARQAYRTALSYHLLHPTRREARRTRSICSISGTPMMRQRTC